MRTRAIALLLALLMAGAPLATLAAPPSALDAYRADELHLHARFFGGLKLVRGGEDADLGFFGGGADEIFAGSDEALEHMEQFRTLRIAGTTLWVAGLSVLIAELIILAVDQDILIESSTFDSQPNGLFWGLLVGGLVVGTAGGTMIQVASGSLSDAVQAYNDDLYERLAQARSGPRAITLRWSGRW